jgi:D,D-heptose 1,7-bisphosphate phosphatase
MPSVFGDNRAFNMFVLCWSKWTNVIYRDAVWNANGNRIDSYEVGMNKAIFLDRDGTINKFVPDLTDEESFELVEGAPEAIRLAKAAGYMVIVITNQPSVAKGFCTMEDVNRVNNHMQALLMKEGTCVDAIYFCPHHPESGFEGEVKELKIACECRKPSPGMIYQAAKDHHIDIAESWTIGDSLTDIQAGEVAGTKVMLLNKNKTLWDAITEIVKVKSVVLAGGKGERLGGDVLKPMIKIAGKPMLTRIIDNAKKYGFKDFIFKTGHMSNVIETYYGDGKYHDCRITYLVEKELLGTAGGLRHLANERMPIIILYGDVITNIDLRKLLHYHLTTSSQATVVVHESKHPEDSDVVIMNEDIIERIVHKPGSRDYGSITNAAILVLNPECFGLTTGDKMDFGKDLLPLLIEKKFRVHGYFTDEYIVDVGTPERLREVECDFNKNPA